MKELIKVHQVNVEVQEKLLFTIKNISLMEHEIIGVVGKNGAGKSKLLQLLAKESVRHSGKIERYVSKEDICLVPQEVAHFSNGLSTSDSTVTHIKRWQASASYDQMSGGEKVKARVKAGIAQKKPLLLLDEPTNHLDEQSIEELIKEMKGYSGTIVLVSHDRYVLDQVATKIWSIEERTLKEYKGNYSTFIALREEDRLSRQKVYETQQKEKKRIHQQMQQLDRWSETAHAQSTKKEGYKEYYRLAAKRMDSQRKSKEKRLKTALEKTGVERVKEDYHVSFNISSSKIKTGPAYIAEQLEKSFQENQLIKNGNFSIMFGDKVAITGENGSGKTTLLRILLGKETYGGKLWTSQFIDVGYLSQDIFDLPLERTMADYFQLDRDEVGKVVTLMVHLGFDGKQWEQTLATLSMGERVKVKLMQHILYEKNVLFLDEPTNHLDIPSREALEKVLIDYQGTIVFVSHDRYFREKIQTKELQLSKKQIIAVSEKVEKKSDDDDLLLTFRKDQLLAQLSTLSSESVEYKKINQEFLAITKRINERK